MSLNKETALGTGAVIAVAAIGYFALLSPQAEATADLNRQITTLTNSNTSTRQQLPKLIGELDTISGQVDALRDLSAQVPPALNVPELYDELASAALIAGLPGGAENVSVTTPTLIAADAPAASASASPSAEPTAPASPAPDPATTATPPAGTIASFEVSLTVKGSIGQTVGFLHALRQSTRLNIVSSSTVTVDANGEATMQVRATYYLQQVDVDGLVQQIEELTNAAAVSTSQNATVPPDALSDPSASPRPSVSPAAP